MNLAATICAYFDSLLKTASFSEGERQSLHGRLLRVWLCRTSEQTLSDLSQEEQAEFLNILDSIDDHPTQASQQLDELTEKIKADDQKLKKFTKCLAQEAKAVSQRLMSVCSRYLSQETITSFEDELLTATNLI